MNYRIVDVSRDLPRHPTKRYPRRNPAGVMAFMPHHGAAWGLTPRKIAEYHIDPDPSRGKTAWPGTAYDYGIPEEDNDIIYLFHKIEEKGYHCGGGGMNTKAMSCCLFGNFDERPPAPWQIDKLVWLIIHTNTRDQIERLIVWHDDHRATACPGRYFPKEELITRVAAHYDDEPAPNPEPEPTPEPEPDRPLTPPRDTLPGTPPDLPRTDQPPHPVNCAVLIILTLATLATLTITFT